jgi:signal transduction histidine kinase
MATEPTQLSTATPLAGNPRRGFSRVLNRSIVYGTLTGAVLVTYAASVVLLRSLLPGETPYAVALLSSGAAALVALPLRDRLQRVVNRLLYGDRDEPEGAIRRLGRQLEASPGAEGVLDTIVATVAESLRLPYVAIELQGERTASFAAAHGAAPDRGELRRIPLVSHGEAVGHLTLAPRAPGEAFSPADLRLLGDLARQAGPAVEAVRLTADLRRSRERLVTAREEERRRLQRDLHDGVGPTLSGALMKMEAARSRLADAPPEAGRMLDELATDTRRAIDEVRRLTYDLRPPLLDQLGLAGALEERAARFVAVPDGLDVAVRVSALPSLGAAVEVAAYHIALEALTNAARHSGASQVELHVSALEGTLVVEVVDDGTGVGAADRAGIGMRSMRERAEELGGELRIDAPTGGGTRIRATLPLRAGDEGDPHG